MTRGKILKERERVRTLCVGTGVTRNGDSNSNGVTVIQEKSLRYSQSSGRGLPISQQIKVARWTEV